MAQPRPKAEDRRAQARALLVGPPGGQNEDTKWWTFAFWAHLDPRTHQGGDDVVFDFSIRVRHAATSDGFEDASRSWTRPQERIVRLGSIAIPRQSLTQNALYDCEDMVFNPWNCLPEHGPLGSVNRMRLAVYRASRQVRRKLNMGGHEPPAEARSFGRTSADAGAAEWSSACRAPAAHRGIY